jgi:pimeloyl-ACP methyl ester carboxylesterase
MFRVAFFFLFLAAINLSFFRIASADSVENCLNIEIKAIARTENIQLKTISTPDSSISARVVGTSDNVMIGISGGPGVSSHYMTELDPLANSGWKVITFDQRGTGRTLSKKKIVVYSMDRYVEDIEAVRQNSGAEKITLFGHSYGALPVMSYAIAHPEHVKAIVLFGGMSPQESVMGVAGANFAKRLALLQRKKVITLNVPDPTVDPTGYLSTISPAYFFDSHYVPSKNLEDTQLSYEANANTYAALGHYDFTGALAALKMPVLIMEGAGDPFGREMPKSVLNSFASAEITHQHFQKCGHFWEECQDQFNKAVEQFAAKNYLIKK